MDENERIEPHARDEPRDGQGGPRDGIDKDECAPMARADKENPRPFACRLGGECSGCGFCY